MALSDQEKSEIRDLVKEATEEVIAETFKVLGIDPENYDHVEEFRENARWTKRYRKLSERVGSSAIIGMMTIMLGGISSAVWHYIDKK